MNRLRTEQVHHHKDVEELLRVPLRDEFADAGEFERGADGQDTVHQRQEVRGEACGSSKTK